MRHTPRIRNPGLIFLIFILLAEFSFYTNALSLNGSKSTTLKSTQSLSTSTYTQVVTILAGSVKFSGTETIKAFSFPSNSNYTIARISLSSMPSSGVRPSVTTPTRSSPHRPVHFTPSNIQQNSFSSDTFSAGNYVSLHVGVICWLAITSFWALI